MKLLLFTLGFLLSVLFLDRFLLFVLQPDYMRPGKADWLTDAWAALVGSPMYPESVLCDGGMENKRQQYT